MKWTRRVFTGLFLASALVGLVGGGFLYYALDDYYEFNEVATTAAPFPLWTLNASRLHLVVEGNVAQHGLLGAEERQARYHLPVGFVHSTSFATNLTPDTPGISPEEVECRYPGNHGDSPFLTGHYLMAQALRWAAYNRTGNAAGQAAASRQIARVLDGLFVLTHVSGVPGHLTRYAFPKGTFPGSVADPARGRFTGRPCPAVSVETRWGTQAHAARNWTGWMYSDDTSRDQNLGAMFGLAAILAFCENQTLLRRAGALACEIVDCLERDNWLVVDYASDASDARFGNSADFDTGWLQSHENVLAFYKVAAQVHPAKYGPKYADAVSRLGYLCQLRNVAIRTSITNMYYPVNLAWQSFWPLVYFEEPAAEGGLRERYQQIFTDVHYATVENHRNAFYQCLWLSVFSPGFVSGQTRVIAELHDTLERMARDRLDGFNTYPAANFSEIGLNISDPADHAALVDPESQAWAQQFAWVDELAGTGGASEEYPANLLPFVEHTRWATPVDWRPPSDFTWQRPPFRYTTRARANSRHEYPHADFTLVYWLCRYLDLVPDPAITYTPATISQAQVYRAWPGALWPSYNQSTTIVGGLP